MRFRWDLGDGTVATEPRVTHAFAAPGFYRVGLTVNNGLLSDLAWRDFYAVEDVEELGTEGQAAEWSWVDPQSQVKFSDDREVRICGSSSLYAFVHPYSGRRVNLLYPSSRQAGWPLAGKKSLVFWFKGVDENVPAWQDCQPDSDAPRNRAEVRAPHAQAGLVERAAVQRSARRLGVLRRAARRG